MGHIICGKLPNLVQWMPQVSRWPLLMFRSHSQRSRSKLPVFKKIVLSISLNHIARKLPHLVQWMPVGSIWTLLIFWSHGQRLRSNYCLWKKCCSLHIFRPLCWKVSKLGTVNASIQLITAIEVQLTCSKVKVKQLVFVQMLSTQYLLTPSLGSCQILIQWMPI